MTRCRWIWCTLLLSCYFLATPTKGLPETVIDIFGPSIPRFPISVFPFRLEGDTTSAAGLSEKALQIITQDLRIAGFFEIIDPSKALADPFERGLNAGDLDWDVLRLLGADIVVGGSVGVDASVLRWEARVYDQPQRRMAFGKAYRGKPEDLRIMVHRFVDEIIRYYTGTPGIFQSQIAFLSKSSGVKEIFLMDVDGENLRQITKTNSINLSPQWSPDGRELAFISYSGPNAYLYSLDLESLKKRVISARENMNGPAEWAPDGEHLALTLTIHGNPELYLVDKKGNIIKRLTQHPGIDVSPSWSPDGRSLAFVSNRSGGPQVYILEIESGNVRRLTFEGNYNTDPAWSPRGDRIAYSAMLDNGYEICSINPDGSQLFQLTVTPGDDEGPCWSPDGSYLAFSSTRNGSAQIFVMLFNGENQVQITNMAGEQTSPAWSPRLESP
jgi:TolB protein